MSPTVIVLYLIVFAAVFFLVEGLYLLAFGKSIRHNSRVSRRIDLLNKGESRETVLATLRKEMHLHDRQSGLPFFSKLTKNAKMANLAFTPKQLIMVMVALALFAFVAMTVSTQTGLLMRVLGAIITGFGAVYIWVGGKAKKRLSLIEEQLPDAVELIVRSLRVGHPFTSALGVVANEIQDPLASELGVISDETSYGRDVGEALKEMAERLDMQDLRFLAVAVNIQQTSGGNLAEVLAGLGNVIRARFKLFRRVKAITAEAKWSGTFLSSFPVVVLIFIKVFKPDYFDTVKETEYYLYGGVAVAVFLILNLVVMRALVNVKV
ncbi:MAG: type II secretion system F family protein [Halocynthiibacter sp.]